jgi:predicted transcriptional regulator
MKPEKPLTKGEMQIMRALWALPEGKGLSSEILEKLAEPKPALTTLLTFLKILREKGYATAERKGRSQLYAATISKEAYTKTSLKEVIDLFFDGSFLSLVSFYVAHEQISDKDANEIIINLLNRSKK